MVESEIYENKFNFDCFFKDMKVAAEKGVLLSFNYKNYIESLECKRVVSQPLTPLLIDDELEESDGSFSVDSLTNSILLFDKSLLITNEDGTEKNVIVYEKNISKKVGVIDPETNVSFGIGSTMAFINDAKTIVCGLSIYFKGSKGSRSKAMYLTLTYQDRNELLQFIHGYSLKEVSKKSAKDWFKKKLDDYKDNPHYLAVLYEYLPIEFLEDEDLKYDVDFFKKELRRLAETDNFNAVRSFIQLWMTWDFESLYEFLNTDLITLYIYRKFTEEYGDRKEIGEYVALLTILHGLYAERHDIPSKIFDMPVNEEFLFEVDAMTTSHGIGKVRVKTYSEERQLWGTTPDRNYIETKLFSPLETLTYRVIVDANELDSKSVAFAQKIPGTNQVAFFSDVPAIFFFYQYEEQYVQYINRGRVEFAINAITSIASIGIAKAIVSPSSRIVFRFAVAEVIFESLHKAITNPIVSSQLQQSVVGSHFLYIWNNYIARAGNAVFILHGLAEIFIALGRSRRVINAVAKSGDPQALNNLAKLTDNGAKTIRSGLNLSDDAVRILRVKGWRLVVDRKNILLKDYTGRVIKKLRPDDVNMYLVYWKLTRIDHKSALKRVFLNLRNSGNRYKRSRALKNGYDIPRTTKGGKTCGDFIGSPYLYDHPKSIVRIELSGSQKLDERLAFKRMGITDRKVMKEILESYTWHHMDDMDEYLKCTMQLVQRKAHEGISSHIGGVRQFEKLIGIKYIR